MFLSNTTSNTDDVCLKIKPMPTFRTVDRLLFPALELLYVGLHTSFNSIKQRVEKRDDLMYCQKNLPFRLKVLLFRKVIINIKSYGYTMGFNT